MLVVAVVLGIYYGSARDDAADHPKVLLQRRPHLLKTPPHVLPTPLPT